MKWNSKNWQGKREDQVESSYAAGYVVVMILTVLAILLLFSSNEIFAKPPKFKQYL